MRANMRKIQEIKSPSLREGLNDAILGEGADGTKDVCDLCS